MIKMSITESEAKEMLQATLDCDKRKNKVNYEEQCHEKCDSCDLCCAQGTVGQHREALQIAIKALEKQGGTSGEAESIRGKAVKWNNHSTKKVPYEFIDFVEGKREIAKDDDVCEWKSGESNDDWKPSCEPNSTYNVFGVAWFRKCPYCGKKIKVVE